MSPARPAKRTPAAVPHRAPGCADGRDAWGRFGPSTPGAYSVPRLSGVAQGQRSEARSC
jgi:hypothetical protein